MGVRELLLDFEANSAVTARQQLLSFHLRVTPMLLQQPSPR